MNPENDSVAASGTTPPARDTHPGLRTVAIAAVLALATTGIGGGIGLALGAVLHHGAEHARVEHRLGPDAEGTLVVPLVEGG